MIPQITMQIMKSICRKITTQTVRFVSVT